LFFRLLLLFTLVPLVELYLLIRIGALIGAGPTILLVLGTGAVGAWLARREGLRSWIAVQQELASGRLPANELLHGLLVVVSGVLLVTPGIFTDAFGLLMLIRPVRTGMIRRVQRRLASRIQAGDVRIWMGDANLGSRVPSEPQASAPGKGSAERGRVIDI
jgi:UPF0716 protein FxsA